MAALQNFIDNSLPTIKAAWLNSVDAFVNTLFAGSTTVTQARNALGVSPQPTFRNRVFNGRFQLGQFLNTITAASGYVVDQWLAISGSTGTFSVARVAAVGLADYPAFGRVSSGAANTISAGAYWGLEQRIEGVNVDDLNWGTANAVTMTLSFWARASIPGIYSVAIRNPTGTHSFVNTFEAVDTSWHRYVVQVPGPTIGTWPTLNASGIILTFIAACGTTYQTGVLATWQSGNFIAASTQTQGMATNGFTFDITGVQFERGSIATDYEFIPHPTELARCQRYYEPVSVHVGGNGAAGVGEITTINERAIKRAAPAITVISTIGIVNVSNVSWGYSNLGPPLVAVTPGTGGWYYQVIVAVDARM